MRTSEFNGMTATMVIIVATMAALPAAAQTAPAPANAATPAAATTEAQEEPVASEQADIIVTAQRREQRLQDVPIAISALTNAQLDTQGITSTQNLAQAVPGLTFTESSGFVQPFIRGIGSTVTNLGEQGTAAVYIDGVYMPSITGQIYELANIQSVEVLKGPQGTLFGRNANSGAIIITTRPPSFTTEGRFQIGYGNFNAVSAQGFVSTPLSDDIAVSVAGNYDRHDGWFTERGGPRIGDTERWGIRGAVLINATPNLSITLNGDILRSDAPGTILAQPVGGYQGFVSGGIVPVDAYDFIGDSRDVGFVADQDGLSARVRWNLGSVELISTTANRWFRSMSTRFDSDSTPTLFAQISQTEQGKALTQEVQLNSTGKGPFTWVVGGFYMRQFAAYAPLRIVSPAGATLITAQQVTKAYAGFADASYNFGDFEITGGLRYSHEPKKYDGQTNGTVVFNDVGKTWNALTPRAVLSYHPSRTLLAYASYSRGFKSGTFNANALSRVPVNPETVTAYEIGLKLTPQSRMTLNISAFQYNIQDLQVQALNPATNLIQVANAARVRSRGVDAEFAVRPIDGLSLRLGASYLDAEFTDFPSAQVFIKSTTVADGRNQAVIRDVTGNQNVRSPKWTFNAAADYSVRFANGGSLVPAASVFYSSSYFWDVGNRLREDPQFVLNGSLTYKLPGDRFSVGIWARNLTDELRSRSFTPSAQADRRIPDEPRAFGVRAGYEFR